jgi:hypothetical protein
MKKSLLIVFGLLIFISTPKAKAAGELAQCYQIVNNYLLTGTAMCIEQYGSSGLFGKGGLFKALLLNNCIRDVEAYAQELMDICNDEFGGGGFGGVIVQDPFGGSNGGGIRSSKPVQNGLKQIDKDLTKKFDGALKKMEQL